MAAARTLNLLRELTKEIRDLDVGLQVPRLSAPIQPVEFLGSYVASNRPCIITGAVDHWPALQRWQPEYLAARAGPTEVTVDVTPSGRGDAVTDMVRPDGTTTQVFCTPQQRRMTLAAFFDLFAASRQPGHQQEVPYLQHQNSNLLQQLPQLLPDCAPSLAWADQALGQTPEAVNVWIGDERSSTTFHRDHYENLYVMVAGVKRFLLLPPSDVWRLGMRAYPAAEFAQDEGGQQLRPVLVQPPRSVLWCDLDPHSTDLAHRTAHPHFFDPSLPPPLLVELQPGEILYLPACWYHYVEQQPASRGGIVAAVNYWYDMKFDVRYAYCRLVEGLAQQLGLLPAHDADADGDEAPGREEADGVCGAAGSA